MTTCKWCVHPNMHGKARICEGPAKFGCFSCRQQPVCACPQNTRMWVRQPLPFTSKSKCNNRIDRPVDDSADIRTREMRERSRRPFGSNPTLHACMHAFPRCLKCQLAHCTIPYTLQIQPCPSPPACPLIHATSPPSVLSDGTKRNGAMGHPRGRRAREPGR